ncbi:MAG: methyltransferase [Spongiibacteraceae bacterium]|nr:methyltransferase [Spongiibacteraceae bacterium]
MNTLTSAFASVNLQRFPLRNNETLQAWDAADELLLKHLAQTNHLSLKDNSAENSKIIILNDAFGSLACSLSTFQVTSWGDSHLAHSALLHNAQANQLASTPQCLASTSELSDEYDIALIKIPKTLALLEQQLIQLKTHLHTNSLVIAAGMTKYMQRSHFALFERYLGPTSTSLAVKKARLIFPTLKQQTPPTPCPYPSQYYDNDVGLTLCNHANVFSRENLDIGARFMIQQFNQLPTMSSSPLRIVDLGCGNGVLGIMAKKQLEQVDKNRGKQVYFIDESYMAIASAKKIFTEHLDRQPTASFLLAIASHRLRCQTLI